MEILFYLFMATVALAASLAALAIWAPRPARIRTAALLLTVLLLPLGYAQYVELLSKPKPRQLEWLKRHAKEAEILGVSFHEGKAIYMWLRVDGAAQPSYYVFPWDLRFAERLQEDVEDAIRRGGKLMMREPFGRKENSELGDLNTEVELPKPMPLKKPLLPPRIFNPRDLPI